MKADEYEEIIISRIACHRGMSFTGHGKRAAVGGEGVLKSAAQQRTYNANVIVPACAQKEGRTAYSEQTPPLPQNAKIQIVNIGENI
jgi:hypothetical protein